MKAIIFTILCSFLLTINIYAQKSDYELVSETVSFYLDGGTNNDFETLKKAFHKTATMKFVGDEYKEVNAIEFFKGAMKPGQAQNRKTRIAHIDISGHAANAKLEIEYPTFTFIDYMNLLKIDGEWKVVNKIFYKRVKE